MHLNILRMMLPMTGLELVRTVLEMKQISNKNCYYGPWWLVFGEAWRPQLFRVYAPIVHPKITTMERLLEIDGIVRICVTTDMGFTNMTGRLPRLVSLVPVEAENNDIGSVFYCPEEPFS